MTMAADSRPITDIAQPGQKVEHPWVKGLREEVANLLGRTQFSFPGAQPVSFARKHLDELRREDYYVCEKSDGIRYLLYMTADAQGELHFLIDRKNDYWQLYKRNLHVPTATDEGGFHTRTLIDGELVMEEDGKGGRQPKFLVFDCLVLDGKPMMHRSLDKRLGYMEQDIITPYRNLFSRYGHEKASQAFLLELKKMQLGYGMYSMFKEVLPRLKHGNDGLIFTCIRTPYQHGTDQHILKWKPVEENTLDFRMRFEWGIAHADEEQLAEGCPETFIDYDNLPTIRLYVFVGNKEYQPFKPEPPLTGLLHLTEKEWEQVKKLDDPLENRVVECGLDDQKRWILHRFRDDKPEANHISTVRSVLDSIRDSVSEKELMDAEKDWKEQWKARRPPPRH